MLNDWFLKNLPIAAFSGAIVSVVIQRPLSHQDTVAFCSR